MKRHLFRNYFSFFVILGLLLPAVLLSPPADLSSSQPVSFIVTGQSDPAALHDAVEAAGGEVVRTFQYIDSVEAELAPAVAQRLSAYPEVASLFPNRAVAGAGNPHGKGKQARDTVPHDYFPEAAGVPELWTEHGLTGKDVTVAVVDSGLFTRHANGRFDPFGDRVLAQVDFTGGSSNDLNGHGYHVAGIIASGLCRGQDIRTTTCENGYQGAAPDANLVSVQVLDKEGKGTYSDVIEGIEWVIANKDRYNIRVMNLSITAPPVTNYWEDPLNRAVMRAWEAGILVVAAAGNSGPGPGSITVPGNVPYVLTVGLFTDNYTPGDWSDDYVAEISGNGPTREAFLKPDVVAPGGHVTSLMPRSTRLGRTQPEFQQGHYFHTLSGTSQSTAVVSGLAALLLEHDPSLTNEQLKARIRDGALMAFTEDSTPESFFLQGAGRVYGPEALASTATNANGDMDVTKDLAGAEHYKGRVVYDEEKGFGFITDSDDVAWAGLDFAWAGLDFAWAGHDEAWAGHDEAWAGLDFAWAGWTSTWQGDVNNISVTTGVSEEQR